MKGLFMVSDTSLVDKLKFDEQGLIPAVIQDVKTGMVLMLAYMNQESLQKTLTGGKTCFYSRSRHQLWVKGETSGHYQYVQKVYYDCDADSLLIQVEQAGVACHEGFYSCFHNLLEEDGSVITESQAGTVPPNDLGKVLMQLYTLAMERKVSRPEGSYTTYLFDKGQDKILKKVGEEAAESIIASKNNNSDEIVYELSDLCYHLMVLLAYHDLDPGKIADELVQRRK